MSYEHLLSPINIGKLTLKNRTVMTAAEMSLGQPDGRPTERMIRYYEERAKGGIAMIIPGICRVNDMGAASTFTQLSMSHDYHIAPMKVFADRIHACDAKLCIQLHHPGRQGYASSMNTLPFVIPAVKAFPGLLDLIFKCTPFILGLEEKKICWSVQSPSKCELSEHGATRIHAMSRREVKKVIRDFVNAAYRCKKAGVDAVELHGGHGYLIQQFWSPNTNKRIDEYGGSFEGRMRFVKEIIQGIQKKCGKDYPIIVRMTADECYDRIGKPGKGYDLNYGKRMAAYLEKLGVAAINVTSGCYDTYNYWLEPTSFETGWRAYMAKAIKEVVSIPVIAANFIRTPEQAEQQIRDGYQDIMGSARAFICDPDWIVKIQEGRDKEIRRCIGCLHCISSFMTNAKVGKSGECALNTAVGIEKEDCELQKDGEGSLAIVVGGGPAGLKAAETLLRRGFMVKLYEKNSKCGGQVILASKCHLKDKLYWCIEDLVTSVTKLGGEIIYNTTVDAEFIISQKPEVVVLATGAEPIIPNIKGISSDMVLTAPQIINNDVVLKDQTVAVIGSGLTGLATAELLAMNGNRVHIVEMSDSIAPGAWFQLIDDELSRLKPLGVKLHTGKKLLKIGNNSIICENTKNKKLLYAKVDKVVLALGVRNTDTLYDQLSGKVNNIYRVGDAAKSGNIASAIASAYGTLHF